MLLLKEFFWGKVSKAHKQKNEDDNVFDVKFDDGDMSKNVWDKHIFKLESQEFKDSILKKGDVVYAPFPGNRPKSECKYK